MAGTEYFGATPQLRDHIPEFCHVNHTISRHWYDCPQPRTIFSHLTQAKYHQITRKNSACWQIDTSWLLSYIRFIQVLGRTVTRSADQHRPCFHTEKSWPGTKFACNFALVQFIWLLKACSRCQSFSGHLRKASNIVPFCRKKQSLLTQLTEKIK